jgi:hypothetical protein
MRCHRYKGSRVPRAQGPLEVPHQKTDVAKPEKEKSNDSPQLDPFFLDIIPKQKKLWSSESDVSVLKVTESSMNDANRKIS